MSRVKHVILAGNYRQAQEYAREKDLCPMRTLIVGVPHALRGLRGPFEVHRVGTYWEDRPLAFLSQVEADLRMVEKMCGAPE